MLKLHVIYYTKKGMKEKYLEALTASGAPEKVRKEDGCLQYEYRPEEGAENELHLYEEWTSEEKQKIHLTQPHMALIRALKDEYVEDTKLIRL